MSNKDLFYLVGKITLFHSYLEEGITWFTNLLINPLDPHFGSLITDDYPTLGKKLSLYRKAYLYFLDKYAPAMIKHTLNDPLLSSNFPSNTLEQLLTEKFSREHFELLYQKMNKLNEARNKIFHSKWNWIDGEKYFLSKTKHTPEKVIEKYKLGIDTNYLEELLDEFSSLLNEIAYIRGFIWSWSEYLEGRLEEIIYIQND